MPPGGEGPARGDPSAPLAPREALSPLEPSEAATLEAPPGDLCARQGAPAERLCGENMRRCLEAGRKCAAAEGTRLAGGGAVAGAGAPVTGEGEPVTVEGLPVSMEGAPVSHCCAGTYDGASEAPGKRCRGGPGRRLCRGRGREKEGVVEGCCSQVGANSGS